MGNIPLPALAVQPTHIDPLQEYGRAVELKNALAQQGSIQQEQELRQGQIEQQQMELNDQRNIRALAPQFATKDENGKVTGFDTNGYFNALMSNSVSPQKIAAMKMQQAQMTEALSKAGSAALDLEDKKNDQAYQVLEGVRDAAKKGPDEAQQAYMNALPKLRALGMNPAQFPMQYPGEDALNHFEVGLGVHKQIIADAKTQSDTQEAVQKTEEAKANTEKVQLENAALKQFGGLTPQMQEAKYLAETQKKNAGQPYDRGFVGAYEHMKTLVPQFNINMANALAGAGKPAGDVAKGFGLTPEAFDQLAEKYNTTGSLPPIGRGNPNAQALNKAIMNRSAELHPGESLAENSAAYKANEQSLGKVQANFDQVSAFEHTAQKNLRLFLDKLNQIPDLGVKFANVPLRMIDDKLIGTKNYQSMKAAQQTAASETAKVLSSANASGVLSDTQKKEAEDILSGNLSYNAARGVVETLEQDFANRHQSYADQIADIKQRMGKKAPTSNNSTQQKTAPTGTPKTAEEFLAKHGG